MKIRKSFYLFLLTIICMGNGIRSENNPEQPSDFFFDAAKRTADEAMKKDLETRKKMDDFMKPRLIEFSVKHYETFKKLRKSENIEFTEEEVAIINKLAEEFCSENEKDAIVYSQRMAEILPGTMQERLFLYTMSKYYKEAIKQDFQGEIMFAREMHLERKKRKIEERK